MRKRHRLLFLAIFILVSLVVVGTFFFRNTEGWSYVDSLYFTAITVTTIGYGDFVPTHDVSKLVAVLYSVIGIPLAIFAFGIIAENYFEQRLARLEKRMQKMLEREAIIVNAVRHKDKKEIESDNDDQKEDS